jgi:cell division protein FtsI/penicillin-binding protein 2
MAAGVDTVPMALYTREFGRLQGELQVPVVLAGSRYLISWTPELVWPGLQPGEQLVSTAKAPDHRGAILSTNRMVLARGPADDRQYPQGAPFYTLTGFVRAPQTAAARRQRVARGWPANSMYGQGGLEHSLDPVLGGVPSITLQAQSATGTRLIAHHPGRRPHDVVTTLDPTLQIYATDALDGRLGGITIMDARNGAVRAASGIAMDAVQPPGSTFKMVTASAALTKGVVTPESSYTPARYALVGGFKLINFHHELCGGTLVQAFAQSCNSVFGPVAVATGGKQLARTAVAFGFNTRSHMAYPLDESVMPSQSALQNPVNLGVAGIGQGGVSATPLQMASVGQVIASRGVLHPPWIARSPTRIRDRRASRRVITKHVADDVAEMMRAVVAYGTGTLASSSIATVNGKTGTAELGPGVKSDAWFVGYAPAEAPRVVVSVLIVHGGVGGQTAAPIARQMIEDALQ